jgi:uncharacterized protein
VADRTEGLSSHRVVRAGWAALGLLAVVVGGIGIVVPGLPTTVFFIIAAGCFSRSSPRLERWVLGLPGIGPMVRDHRAGKGIPRRAKRAAIVTIVAMVTLSVLLLDHLAARIIVGVAGAAGISYLAWRVPTRIDDP